MGILRSAEAVEHQLQRSDLSFETIYLQTYWTFPEQAVNWDWFSEKIRNANREIKVLNLFAYTGGATLAAAKAGAKVTHVDASRVW